MRSEQYKQVIAICESNAEDFQDKLNNALAGMTNPEITFDPNRSFTAYVTYNVRKDVPEDVLELLEMINGESHYCDECPYFEGSNDKRRKWGSCTMKKIKTRPEGRACEHFYLWRFKQLELASAKYKEIPFQIE